MYFYPLEYVKPINSQAFITYPLVESLHTTLPFITSNSYSAIIQSEQNLGFVTVKWTEGTEKLLKGNLLPGIAQPHMAVLVLG